MGVSFGLTNMGGGCIYNGMEFVLLQKLGIHAKRTRLKLLKLLSESYLSWGGEANTMAWNLYPLTNKYTKILIMV